MDTLGSVQGIFGVNELGFAVGSSNNRAVVWYPDGSIVDLNTLVNPSPGTVLMSALSISDTGWIVGNTLPPSFDPNNAFELRSPAFALQIPEPSSLSLLLLTAPLLLRPASRRHSN